MLLESMCDCWIVFGWDVLEMNGDEMEDIIWIFCFIDYMNKKFYLFIFYIIKGKGVFYMEGIVKWYYGVFIVE